ncbi:MAG: ATP-binding protein [Clostridia bacterium]|nr:ATP-binding protein [Clostridia bacterium]MBR3809835.1 ATP-binding protein [Clostridia bacterium]
MRELSLNILDIAQNSIVAGATLTEIVVNENTKENTLLIGIYDNGCGMTAEQVRNVIDPFFTTRTTRKVGMGIPLFKMAAEQTGGSFKIESEKGVGTKIEALFKTDNIDFTPLGDIASTIVTIVSMNNDKEFLYKRVLDDNEFVFSTVEIKKILDGVPLSEPSVMSWIEQYLNEQYNELLKG